MQTRKSRKMPTDKSTSIRQLRAGELIRHILAEIFSRGPLSAFGQNNISITVSEVRMSPDLRRATCFVMPLGGEQCDTALEELRRANSWLNTQVAGKVRLKFTPKLNFCIDPSFDEAGRIQNLLRSDNVVRDLLQMSDEADTSEE